MAKTNIEKIQDGYTHDGCFHADDVIATALLLSLNPKIKIHRVSTVKKSVKRRKKNIVYDIGFGQYDHHQENRRINDYGYPYSAFGLLWEDYGRDLLVKKGFKKVDEAFYKFRESIVSKVDQGDNCGYNDVMGFTENYKIKQFNASWYELKPRRKNQEKQFEKAVSYATLLFENWLRRLYEQIEMPQKEREIFEKAIEKSEGGVAILKENIPWREFVKNDKKGLKIVINKNLRGGYNVLSVDSEALKIKPNKYLSFVHPSNFMGVAKTRKKAIKAARVILQS